MADNPDESGTKPFAAMLQEVDNGHLLRELGEDLQALVALVRETGRKGSLTVTLTLSKSKADRVIDVVPLVKVTRPKQDRPTSIFYADASGNLHRNDPQQGELPGIRAVPAADEGEARAVPAEPAARRAGTDG